MSGIITRAHLSYAGAMALVHAASFPAEECWAESAIAEQLDLPGRFGFIHTAEEPGDDPAGVQGSGMVLARIVADESEILTLGVAADSRRAGIGRALLQAAIDQARQYGAQAMFLEVAAHNEAARGLYAEFGFSEIGLRRAYYQDGSDAIVLRRALAAAP